MCARTVLLRFLLGLAMLGFGAGEALEQLPAGWIRSGSHPEKYEMGIDRTVSHSGKASGAIRSTVATPEEFATLMQQAQVGDYRGKRIRLSGYVKPEGIEEWAGLWLRIDGENPVDPGKFYTLAFDNMQDRPIKGTRDWKRYDIILDVPKGSLSISFGILLAGKGRAWVDDLKFEVVGKEVKLTGSMEAASSANAPIIAVFKSQVERYHKQPANLDFEQ